MRGDGKQWLKKYGIVTLGTMLMGAGVSCFYVPCRVVGGGVSGLSTILYYLAGIPADVSVTVINLILFIIAGLVLGKRFAFGSLYGLITVSLAIRLFSYVPALTQNTLMAAIYGGFLYGCGAGLALSVGASTGGTDIIGRLLQHRFPHLPIGKLLLVVDGLVIAASVVYFRDSELLLAGVLALVISTGTVDMLMRKLNRATMALVVTEKGEELAARLVQCAPRGITLLEGRGAYSGAEKRLLLCVLKEAEVAEYFQQTVQEVDSQAFVIFSQAEKIMGNGFSVYK